MFTKTIQNNTEIISHGVENLSNGIVVSTILFSIIFVSFWYCGVFNQQIELSISYVIVVQKVLVEMESSHYKGGAIKGMKREF